METEVLRILDPLCTENQVPPSKRLAGFEQLPYALSDRYDVRRRLSESDIRDYGARVLGAQAERPASDLLVAAHRAGRIGTVGRENDLDLARTAYDIVQEHRFAVPGPDDASRRRRLLVPIIAHVRALLGNDGERLLEEYAKVRCDGYIGTFAGLHDGAGDAEIIDGASWLFELKRRTGKEVYVFGAGELSMPFLLNGLDGALVPVDGRPRIRWPHGPSRAKRRERYFHPAALSEVLHEPLSGRDQTHAEALFAEYGCGCGRHPDLALPAQGAQRTEHTLVSRARLAALSATALATRLERAEEVVVQYRLSEVDLAGWALVAQAARATLGRERRSA